MIRHLMKVAHDVEALGCNPNKNMTSKKLDSLKRRQHLTDKQLRHADGVENDVGDDDMIDRESMDDEFETTPDLVVETVATHSVEEVTQVLEPVVTKPQVESKSTRFKKKQTPEV